MKYLYESDEGYQYYFYYTLILTQHLEVSPVKPYGCTQIQYSCIESFCENSIKDISLVCGVWISGFKFMDLDIIKYEHCHSIK